MRHDDGGTQDDETTMALRLQTHIAASPPLTDELLRGTAFLEPLVRSAIVEGSVPAELRGSE
jgi:hypothetical protein